jgi:hypothetical protein
MTVWVFYCTKDAGLKSQRYMKRVGKMPFAAQGKPALTKGRRLGDSPWPI